MGYSEFILKRAFQISTIAQFRFTKYQFLPAEYGGRMARCQDNIGRFPPNPEVQHSIIPAAHSMSLRQSASGGLTWSIGPRFQF
jgi:hypothetical protein